MSVLDKLENFSARKNNINNVGVAVELSPFSDDTAEGLFLNKVHNKGYKIYDLVGYEDEEHNVIEREVYDTLSDIEKGNYKAKFEYTELCNLLRTTGNQCINAIAGAGKTSALVFKVMYDIVTGEATRVLEVNDMLVRAVDKVWVCTFLKSGADELKEAYLDWEFKMSYPPKGTQINFSTLDAEFKRCLNEMNVQTNIGTNQHLDALLKKAIDSCNVRRKDGSALLKEDYNIISTIVKYYRSRLENKYNPNMCMEYDITPHILQIIVEQYSSLKLAENVMDFEDIQELLYKYLYVTPNPNVQDFVANRYNYMYIDEFQDTSQLQYAILKFYARGHLAINTIQYREPTDEEKILVGAETKGKIVAIGDPSQCIYSFKGSDSKILTQYFEQDFKPCYSELSVNWRCPENILNPIVPSIHMNKDSASQKIKAAKQGGIFNAYEFTSFRKMIDYLCDDVKSDLDNNMNVAILCRTNYDGAIPAFVLQSQGDINFSISSDSMTLASSLPKRLIGLTSLINQKAMPSVKESLEFLVPKHSKYSLNILMDALKNNNMSIWELPLLDITASCPWLEDFVTKVKPILMPYGTLDKDRELVGLRAIYEYYLMNVFNGNTVFSQGARTYVETLLYLLDNHKNKSLYSFVCTLEELNDALNARIGKNKANVHIITVHESKGKEFDSVYVWNDSENIFPSHKCKVTAQEDLEEERRIHYIACTRARKKCSIYTIQGKVGMFVDEMDLKLVNPVRHKMTI